MIFCGDIAIPYRGAIKWNMPKDLSTKTWIGNLEGTLLKDSHELSSNRIVFNDLDAIHNLCQEVNFKVFNLANNHLFDAGNFNITQHNLRSLGVKYVGTGENLIEARKPLIVKDENGIEYVIISFGWDAINCVYAQRDKNGVNPYTTKNVIYTVQNTKEAYPDKKIIALFHWNYELELYPQPLDRAISYRLIDLGVFAVIGCHAHRVQGIEYYKGRPIVYGLGNFLFSQGKYMGGKLSFPDFTKDEIAVELNSLGDLIIHRFYYNVNQDTIDYIKSESIETSDLINNLSAFTHIPLPQYPKWLKQNRYHKKKLLPLFYISNNSVSVRLKCFYIQMRDCVILLIKKLLM